MRGKKEGAGRGGKKGEKKKKERGGLLLRESFIIVCLLHGQTMVDGSFTDGLSYEGDTEMWGIIV